MLAVPPNSTDDVDTKSKHWYISYNPVDVSIYGCRTTALVLGEMEYFLVLNGDHREEFHHIMGLSFEQRKGKSYLRCCLDYIRDHRDLLNKLSEPLI